ncbi:MAG: sulfite exporter TauE/SafE family protein [Ferruginibacter sp.]
MWEVITAGLIIGALGSFHCVGMCGPLALSLPLKGRSLPAKFLASLLYNAGRVVTYALLGAAVGFIGHSVALFGYQQWLSISLGITILLALVLSNCTRSAGIRLPLVSRFFTALRKRLGKLYQQEYTGASFLIGLLNGLLPCGLVYMAIAGAVATGSVMHSSVFMAAFGLGTLPVMWAVSFFGNYMAAGLRLKIRKLYPYILAVMACLLILRGLGLGIPYVSPKISTVNQKEAVECGLQH